MVLQRFEYGVNGERVKLAETRRAPQTKLPGSRLEPGSGEQGNSNQAARSPRAFCAITSAPGPDLTSTV
jgi:hypothetical protein